MNELYHSVHPACTDMLTYILYLWKTSLDVRTRFTLINISLLSLRLVVVVDVIHVESTQYRVHVWFVTFIAGYMYMHVCLSMCGCCSQQHSVW